MNEIKLLATDLDGTLVTAADEFDLHEQLRDTIGELRRRNDAVWVVTTGRNMQSYRKVFVPLAASGLVPDYVITKHAFIHRVTARGHVPHIIWNVMVRYSIWRDLRESRHLLRKCLHEIRRKFRRVQTVVNQPERVCVRFSDAGDIESAADVARKLAGSQKNLQLFEHLTHLDIRTIPHTKGVALLELARHLGIQKANVLAIGDGHNDISMLDGTCSNMSACPRNASPVVMRVVADAHGHISVKPGLAGTIEAIRAFMNGLVRGELPANWSESYIEAISRPPNSLPKPGNTLIRTRQHAVSAGILVGSVIAIVIVLARHDLLGPLSPFIDRPITWFFDLVANLVL